MPPHKGHNSAKSYPTGPMQVFDLRILMIYLHLYNPNFKSKCPCLTAVMSGNVIVEKKN